MEENSFADSIIQVNVEKEGLSHAVEASISQSY
jgi:hypothetical protein